MKSLRNGIIGLSALITTALMPMEGKSMGVNWGNIQSSGAYTAVSFDVNNDNAGTTYNSVTLNSITQLMNLLYAGSSYGNARHD